MSAWAKATFLYFPHFFCARLSILAEKSVAVRRAHRGASTAVSSPVPQAHSSTVSAGETRPATTAHSRRLALRLMRSAKMSYAHATLSQNMAALPCRPGAHKLRLGGLFSF